MHDVEKAVAALLEAGVVPTLENLGGVEAVTAAQEQLSGSPFSSHIVHAALVHAERADETVLARLERLACACFRDASDDLTLYELNSILKESSGAKGRIGDAIFRTLADRLQLPGAPAACRGAAMEGLLRLSFGSQSRQLRLAAELLDTDFDDAAVQPMLAKALGVVWSQVRDGALMARLEKLADMPGGSAEATFELGMAHLAQALEASDAFTAQVAFETAKSWFDRSLADSEERPAARLYSLGISALLAFGFTGRIGDGNAAGVLLSAVFELQAYNRAAGEPGWLGLRRIEALHWFRLGLTLDALSRKLWEPAWWEPAAVVGSELLAAYAASRTMLQRDRAGGVEALVQPRLQASLLEQAGQLHQVKAWLARHPMDVRAGDAKALLRRIEDIAANLLPSGGVIRRGRAAGWGTEGQGETDGRVKALLEAFVGDTDRRLPALAQEKIEECLEALDGHADLLASPGFKMFIGQIIYFSTCFIVDCIDRASRSDPLSSYLFERDPDALPREGKLQEHYAALMRAWMGSVGVEVRAVGGGRADVVFTRGGDRLVVEVKRELQEAAPEALFSAYGAQAEEYQNASARVGILLVLDLTRPDGKGLHLGESIARRSLRRSGESADRLLFLFRISGCREPPSRLMG